ncbi:hypothetical protein [Maribacter sp. HTCC2170]|uniref:hypothetical protein n=1 Tax=Maribacter sp. (strain HTCC2170 / KCCM 42371) TaxID=313603 RepID=UPI00006BD1DC|nr:hypothetical protein [Maribacter sp. HTCC2170]EAR02301.1 hypothetical protein FB2170_03420 [Maribacter sp. HTCC2170]
MSKQATKTKSRTEGTINKSKFVLFIGILLGALIILIAPLLHIGLEKKNPDVEAYRAQLAEPVEALNLMATNIRADYDNGRITASQYIEQSDQLNKEVTALQAENKALIKTKVDQARVFGWTTTRKFIIGLGIRLPFLIFSIIISMLIARDQSRDKNLKKAFFILQTACYAISFYVVIWCFWYVQDYPLEVYWSAMIAFCILAGAFTTYSFRYYESNLIKIVKIKGSFLNFLVEIRNKHYKPMLKKAMIQGLYDEAYQEEIKMETKEFDKRLRVKAEELID